MATEDDEQEFLAFAAHAYAEFRRRKETDRARTIGELWRAWVASQAGGKRIDHIRGHGYYVTKVTCTLGDRQFVVADLRWPEFDHDHVRAWLDAIARTPSAKRGVLLAPGSRDQVRLGLQACFAWHVKVTKLVTANPLSGIPLEAREPHRRQGYFTPEIFAEFLKHCRPLFAAMLRVSARCGGLRRDEVRLLRKDGVDYQAGELVVRNKGGRIKRVLATGDALEEIASWAKLAPGEYVFANPQDPKGGPVPTSTMWRWMKQACDASGIKLAGEKPVFHHARHTAGRWRSCRQRRCRGSLNSSATPARTKLRRATAACAAMRRSACAPG